MGKKVKDKKKPGLKKNQSFLSLNNLDISEDEKGEEDDSKSKESSLSSIFDSDQEEKATPISITPS